MMNTVTASIDIDALQHNFTVVRRHAPHSKIIAVLKANACGHGLLQVAHALAQADACGWQGRGGAGAACQRHHQAHSGAGRLLQCRGAAAAGETRTANHLHTWEQLAPLEQASLPAPIKVWLKLDTGMNRLGLRTLELPASSSG